ncbi:MAG: hypothetical protein ACLQVY_03250 [Limisphaerales bacterium]
MGAITFSLDERLVEFLARELPLKLFVETGAFHGDSLALAKRFIPECRSVEMSPELFDLVAARFRGEPNVQVQRGDSPSFLREHEAEFAAQPVLFWLDAHWCVSENVSGKSSQSPLLAELGALRSLHPDSVVLIDDARLYLCAPPHPHHYADWPDFHSVLTALLPLSSRHRVTVLNDVITFYPERMAPAMQEFAHRHGVDWLTVTHELNASQTRDRERRARRFPSVNFFRHLLRKTVGRRPSHAPH